MKISELSELERPYEKLEKYGVEYLSNAELLAIILRSGTREYSSIDLANMVLKKSENKIRNVFFNNITKIINFVLTFDIYRKYN